VPDRKLNVTQQKAPDYRFVVDVFDEKQNLICYCGPYSKREMMECLAVFMPHGWHIGKVPEGVV
jgi:hypothetical protein